MPKTQEATAIRIPPTKRTTVTGTHTPKLFNKQNNNEKKKMKLNDSHHEKKKYKLVFCFSINFVYVVTIVDGHKQQILFSELGVR